MRYIFEELILENKINIEMLIEIYVFYIFFNYILFIICSLIFLIFQKIYLLINEGKL